MSDPAKSPREIEDVLASIRRLVSESHVPAAAPVAAVGDRAPQSGGEAAADDAGAGKLVLTPSLRVNDPDDPWAPVARKPQAEDGDSAGQTAATEDDDPSWGLEDRLSDWGEIEASADESVADALAEQMADPYSTSGDAWQTQGFEAATDTDPDRDLAEFEPETGDADWPDRSAGSALRQLALVRGQGDAAAVDGDLPPVADDPQGAPVSARTEPEQDPAPLTAPDTDHSPSSETETQMTPDRPTDPEVAEAVSGSAPVFSRRPAVHRPGAAADDRDDAASHQDADDIEDLGDEGSSFTFPETEDGILDEETLRDIIAEVVREELQGAMGQRITRNVRKMVRREIRLALAAEDLE